MIQYEDDFCNWLKSDNLTDGTIRNLRFAFVEFARFCLEIGVDFDTLSVDVSRQYMIRLNERPSYQKPNQLLSKSTILKHFQFLKKLERYLNEKGLYIGILVGDIRRPQPRKTVINGFTAEQLQAIIDAVRETRKDEYYRDRMTLILYLLASTGLRIGEALRLNISDFDFKYRVMLVLGKGDKERIVPFSPELRELLQIYIQKYNLNKDDLLFASRYGKPLSPATIRDALRVAKRRLGTKYNIDQMRVSPHTFRHTFAKLWVVNDGNQIALSRIMGHESMAMTNKYVQLWSVDLTDAYDTCNPCKNIKISME
ncbi:tyrosine recombinase XerC [Paenibacillus montaniterrae]|uniref:Tyrosine recombinase XerC n=1 Tax=Paenibacillus montaniterrae TaxID=429341 RepID=A0A919YNI8_9BACL|nr:tyrosine-type recombinase/integrase [Paenibacillus montaniterrae]GIP17747.1 tyrosine recombinase XerC [Paenibacillus montaniterrae]